MATYRYKCPDCGTRLEFRKRVTLTRRRCPHCGKLITPEEIDKQEFARKVGCLLAVGLIVLIVILLNKVP